MTLTRRTIDHAVAAVYAAACFSVVLAPALAVQWTVLRTDVGGMAGGDLVVASVLVGAWHAAVAWIRLRCEKRVAERRSHIWIASLNALVVLALSASLLVLGVLEHYADEHAAFANRGWPVVALWAGLQLVAVGLAELTGRFVFWWLEPHPEPHRCCRWGVLPPAQRLFGVGFLQTLLIRGFRRLAPPLSPAPQAPQPTSQPAPQPVRAAAQPVRRPVAAAAPLSATKSGT